MPSSRVAIGAICGICGIGALTALVTAAPARAWTPGTQARIAAEAARLAPPDLARQIARHRKSYDAGVAAPFADTDPGRHRKYEDGTGSLDRVVAEEVEGAIAAIRGHQPFEEVVQRLGTVSHFVADADNPLAASGADPEVGRYFADFLRYAESAEPRFPLVFYGLPPGLDGRRGLTGLLDDAFRRGRELSPFVGREYRRLDFASGIGRFDDRSSAFGVASVAFSHAVTDVAAVLRYIWLQAGGADERAGLAAGSGGDRV
ncbi:MAG TPA: hypothetical protein VOA87_07650, partial [Thermoanaerobaculia bacterium]|nr:hypothetical protein [Thermoanaerobaculia bacterium]